MQQKESTANRVFGSAYPQKRCKNDEKISMAKKASKRNKKKRVSLNRIEHLLHICNVQLKQWNDLLKQKRTTYFAVACMSFVRSFVLSVVCMCVCGWSMIVDSSNDMPKRQSSGLLGCRPRWRRCNRTVEWAEL